ncbi:MAG: GNAT family N-acetyltransferase [candidate division WOR-3 bacterium]
MNIRLCRPDDIPTWDRYVAGHRNSTHCHMAAWKTVIENAYGHKGFYLLAETEDRITGVLPLIHIQRPFGGDILCSMPFLNYGGPLADSPEVSRTLLRKALCLADRLGARTVEIRQTVSLGELFPDCARPPELMKDKVRMLLPLQYPSERFLASFKSKLRSQIRRPIKEGMQVRVGGAELLDAFYRVFARNMRDLGSPVHSMGLFYEILALFGAADKTNPAQSDNGKKGNPRGSQYSRPLARIGAVFHGNDPVAAGLVIGFRSTMEIPWASSLNEYNRFSPNMLLYWTLIEQAIESGFQWFDFGRSTPQEGTYRFKEQWGAKPHPLYWYRFGLNTGSVSLGLSLGDFSKIRSWVAIAWSRLPLRIANRIGPRIRRAIPL